MSVVEVSLAAAVAVLGVNLLSDSPHRQASQQRTLRGIALAGSAAAGDTRVRVLVNQVEIANIFNSGTGFPNRDDLKLVNAPVPGNSEVSVIVTDAPATNPINLMMEFT